MQSKRVQILIVLLVLSAVYSLVSVFLVNNQTASDAFLEPETNKHTQPASNSSLPVDTQTNNRQVVPSAGARHNSAINSQDEIQLPKRFLLVGTRLNEENSSAQSEVILSYNGGLHNHFQNDFLLDSDMQLTAVYKSQIDVSYQGVVFTIELSPPNLLSPDFRNPAKTYSEFLDMTPDEIGSRPRILEHLVILTPTPYIADGQLIYPGLNPDLFAQAGFMDDDVLKTINGKSVTIESELNDIKQEITGAQTLVFEVMRKGRMITLYLDIPSESLEIKR